MAVNCIFFKDGKNVLLMENTRFKSPHLLWCNSMGSLLLPHFMFIFLSRLEP